MILDSAVENIEDNLSVRLTEEDRCNLIVCLAHLIVSSALDRNILKEATQIIEEFNKDDRAHR